MLNVFYFIKNYELNIEKEKEKKTIGIFKKKEYIHTTQ